MSKNQHDTSSAQFLVVIDHQEAKIYRTETQGSNPLRIEPYDPHGYGKHLHSAHDWTDGKGTPDQKKFYDAVVKTLQGAEQILLFGSGTGKSSAMDHLSSEIHKHHPELAKKIIGSVVIDAHHTTENQILAKAREFYAEYNKTSH